MDSLNQLKELVNLERYPLLNLESPEAKKIIEAGRKQLKEQGCCALPGFIRAEAIPFMAQEAQALSGLAYHSTVTGNAYLEPTDDSLPKTHPKNLVDTTTLGAVAYDQIPVTTALRKLYEWEPLVQLLAAILDKPKLYRYADTLSGLNIAVMKENDYLRWHFDQTDFVTSLALQDSEKGGDFEFVPRIRSASDERYDKVKNLLNGSNEGVVHLEMTPGTLILFEGRYSIHRVTRIEGKTPRLVALLGYDTKPGLKGTEYLQYMRYGRTAPSQPTAQI